MAIAEMKRMTLVGMNADKGRILKKLQKLGCVEIIRAEDQDPGREAERLAQVQGRLDTVEWAVKKLTPYDPVKRGLFDQRPVADSGAIAAAQAGEGETLEKAARLEELERALGEVRSEELRCEAAMARLRPWQGLGVSLSALRRKGSARFLLVSGQPRRLEVFRDEAGAISPRLEIEEMPVSGGHAYAAIAVHASAWDEVEALVRETGLERVQLDEFSDTPEAELAALQAHADGCAKRRAEIHREMEDMGGDLESMRLCRDMLVLERDRQQAAARMAETKSAFVMEAWVPADKCGEVRQAALKGGRDVCVDFRDCAEDEKPPTLLVNNRLARPFEAVIDMFALPDPRSFDPTAIMAPFFALQFGFMVSDAGYGVVMMILTLFYLLKAKPRGVMGQMTRILFWGGASTTFWGALFGGWFGETWNPILFSPLDNPVSMMLLCAAMGLVHVLTGVGCAAYMNIRRGKYWDAVWDQGTWFLMLVGVAVLALGYAQAGKWMAIAGAAGVLLFGGRAKKNPFARLVGGAGKLYDVTSYLGDILSFMRLFGMGLATGVIGMVFNLLAGIVMGSIPGVIIGVAVMIAGHSFNLVINALGAYVNACRLQYIEFFGHFYEQGGVPFQPLRYNTRYVDIDPLYDAE